MVDVFSGVNSCLFEFLGPLHLFLEIFTVSMIILLSSPCRCRLAVVDDFSGVSTCSFNLRGPLPNLSNNVYWNLNNIVGGNNTHTIFEGDVYVQARLSQVWMEGEWGSHVFHSAQSLTMHNPSLCKIPHYSRIFFIYLKSNMTCVGFLVSQVSFPVSKTWA